MLHKKEMQWFNLLSVSITKNRENALSEVFEEKLAYVFLRISNSQTGPHTPVHFALMTTL